MCCIHPQVVTDEWFNCISDYPDHMIANFKKKFVSFTPGDEDIVDMPRYSRHFDLKLRCGKCLNCRREKPCRTQRFVDSDTALILDHIEIQKFGQGLRTMDNKDDQDQLKLWVPQIEDLEDEYGEEIEPLEVI